MFQELFVDSHVELLYMIEVEDVGLGVTAPAAVKVNQACMIFTSSFSFKDIGSRKKSYADFFEFKNLREFFLQFTQRWVIYILGYTSR